MNNNYLARISRNILLNALKNLRRIDGKEKINVMRIAGGCVQFCATNGIDIIKISLDMTDDILFKDYAGALQGTEYVLGSDAINKFISFLELGCLGCDEENISIAIDEGNKNIVLFQNKNLFIAAKYIAGEQTEKLYLLKTREYSDLTNDDLKITPMLINIPLSDFAEIISIAGGFKNETLPLLFRYNNEMERIDVEAADLAQVMRYNIKLSEADANIVKELQGNRNGNVIFSLNLSTFKKIYSLVCDNSDEKTCHNRIMLDFNNSARHSLKICLNISQTKTKIEYLCRMLRFNNSYSNLDKIFKNDEFLRNLFAFNTEDIEAISDMVPLMNGQSPCLFLEFDIPNKYVNVRNGNVSDTDISFLIKRKLIDIKNEPFENNYPLRAMLFSHNINALKKYLRTHQKNNEAYFDNIIFRYRINARNMILLYYFETENLQYCFAGGTIKDAN